MTKEKNRKKDRYSVRLLRWYIHSNPLQPPSIPPADALKVAQACRDRGGGPGPFLLEEMGHSTLAGSGMDRRSSSTSTTICCSAFGSTKSVVQASFGD